MIGKFIIAVCGDDVMEACSIHRLCSGLKATIECAVLSMMQMWDDHAEEDDWGVHFAFNTYRHYQKLALQGQKELVVSKEGAT
eukprot:12177465-Ditylum_brightwellii.AAC.1